MRYFKRLYILFLFATSFVHAQTVDTLADLVIQPDTFAKPYLNFEVDAKYITSDKLQQCYVVSTQNELSKYNATGQLLFQFNNNRLGDLEWVDVTDPFNPLLFYPEYLTVITLDRTLNKTGEYQLYDLDIVEVKAIAMSNDNHLWLFDETSSRIRKINQQGNVLIEGANMNLLLGKRLQPNFMIEHDNLLYLNVPETGILVFDNFATYLKTIPIKDLSQFQILGKQLIFEEAQKTYTFHLQSLLTREVRLPIPYQEDDQIRIQQDVLFVLSEEQLRFYKLDQQ